MSKRAHSTESVRIRFSTAALAAPLWAMPGIPLWGERVTLKILPPRPEGIIALVATAWVTSHVPSTLSWMTVRKPFGGDRLGRRQELAAGVVDEQVDLPVGGQDRVDHGLDLVLLADIARVGFDQTVGVGGHGLAQRLGPAPADRDAGAATGQLQGRLAPQSAAASGHDRHLALEQGRREQARAQLGGGPAPLQARPCTPESGGLARVFVRFAAFIPVVHAGELTRWASQWAIRRPRPAWPARTVMRRVSVGDGPSTAAGRGQARTTILMQGDRTTDA